MIGKLSNTTTGDSLATKANPVQFDRPKMSVPYEYKSYRAKNKGDEDKVSQALSRMMEEDLTLRVVSDKENHQSLLYGIG